MENIHLKIYLLSKSFNVKKQITKNNKNSNKNQKLRLINRIKNRKVQSIKSLL